MEKCGHGFNFSKARNMNSEYFSNHEKAFLYLQYLLAKKDFADRQYEYEDAFCSGFWRGYRRLNKTLPVGAQKIYLEKCAQSALGTFCRDSRKMVSLKQVNDMTKYPDRGRFFSPPIAAQINELREALPIKEKTLLDFCLEGDSYVMIAAAMDQAESTVRYQVEKLRKFARRFI
jgi:hypothetical protein